MRGHRRAVLLVALAIGASYGCEAGDSGAPLALLRSDGAVAVAGAAGQAQICHVTSGTGGILLLSVSGRAVPGHLGHGDYLAITYRRDPGTDPSLPETVVACEPPPGYSEDPCSTLVSSFTDVFSGSTLDPAWQTVPGSAEPEICAGEVCNEEAQAVAFRTCLAPASAWEERFKWRADGPSDREAYAVVASGDPFDPATTTYSLGCDGGFQDPVNGGDTCGFVIHADPGADPVGPVDGGVIVGRTYTIVATGTSSGALSVRLLDDGGVELHRHDVTVAPFTPAAVGFVLGRTDDDVYAYLDDFRYTSTP